MEEDVAPLRPGRAIALVGVVLLAVGLAVLPVLVGSGSAPRPVALVAAGLGSLVAVFGGVKLAAVILGAARFRAEPSTRVPAAGID